jgi:hypothetical protein
MSEGSSHGFLDSVGTWLFNVFDGCEWYVPALLLTILFFVALALFCYMIEDVPLEVDILCAPKAIFSWTKDRWERARKSKRDASQFKDI